MPPSLPFLEVMKFWLVLGMDWARMVSRAGWVGWDQGREGARMDVEARTQTSTRPWSSMVAGTTAKSATFRLDKDKD